MLDVLCEDRACAVLDGGDQSEWFEGKPALSCKSGILFSMEADGIMKKTTERQHRNTMEIHVQTG